MTEEEAKTKLCCGPPAAAYAAIRPGEPFLCVASACTAWRPAEIKYRSESAGPQGGYKRVAISDGFCGLAGQP